MAKTQVKIPLDIGEVIDFEFKTNDLPHLLGLNKLIDIPVLLAYSNKKKSAQEIYIGIKKGEIDTEQFKNSKYFEEIFETKVSYFNSDMIINLLNSKKIIKFDPNKIKKFQTKLEKVDYMFFAIIKDEKSGYSHFGIAFITKNNKNHPNTLFVRENNDYIEGQTCVYPNSLYLKDKNKNITFKIYWDNVRKSMKKQKNSHYKALDRTSDRYGYNVNCLNDVDIKKSYNLVMRIINMK